MKMQQVTVKASLTYMNADVQADPVVKALSHLYSFSAENASTNPKEDSGSFVGMVKPGLDTVRAVDVIAALNKTGGLREKFGPWYASSKTNAITTSGLVGTYRYLVVLGANHLSFTRYGNKDSQVK